MVDQQRRNLIKTIGALGTGTALIGCSGDGESNPEGELNGSTLEPTAGQEATKSPEPTVGDLTATPENEDASEGTSAKEAEELYSTFVDTSRLRDQGALTDRENPYTPEGELNRNKGVYLTREILDSLDDDLEELLVEESREGLKDQAGIGYLNNPNLRDEEWRTVSGYTFQFMGTMQYRNNGNEYLTSVQESNLISEFSEEYEENGWTVVSFVWDEPETQTVQNVKLGAKDDGTVAWASDYKNDDSRIFRDLDQALRLKRRTVEGEVDSVLKSEGLPQKIAKTSMNKSTGKHSVDFGYGRPFEQETSNYTGFTRRYEVDNSQSVIDGWKYDDKGEITDEETVFSGSLNEENLKAETSFGFNLV
jgi:hypothetical protein